MSSKFTADVSYMAVSKYSVLGFTLIVSAILARLLTPDEFGLVAMITVVIGFFNLLANLGIGPAVVSKQDLHQGDLRSIFTITLVLGLLLTFICILTSFFISTYYGREELSLITRILSVSIFFNAIKIVPKALMSKRLEFKKLASIAFFSSVVSGVIAVILALLDFGYFALVYQSVLFSIISFFYVYKNSPILFTSNVTKTSIQKIINFSLNQTGFTVINYFTRNQDNLVISKVLGLEQLGYYDKAYRLMLLPLSNLTHVITPVLMPTLAAQSSLQSATLNYTKVFKVLSYVGFPLSVFLYLSAAEIITIVFGDQWGESILIFKYLSLSVGVQLLLSSTGAVFQALDKTHDLFKIGILGFMMSLGALLVLYISGLLSLINIAIAISTFYTLFTLVIVIFLHRKMLPLNIKYLRGIFLVVCFMCASLYFSVDWLSPELSNSNIYLVFFLKLFLLFVTYTLGLFVSLEMRNLFKEILSIKKKTSNNL